MVVGYGRKEPIHYNFRLDTAVVGSFGRSGLRWFSCLPASWMYVVFVFYFSFILLSGGHTGCILIRGALSTLEYNIVPYTRVT